MKRVSPYIFPLIVIAIVFFLVYRWYSMRNQQIGDAGEYGEGIEIENLSEDTESLLIGNGNVKTSPLEPTPDSASDIEGIGTIRYEIRDGRVRFSVAADLPQPAQPYTVWIRTRGQDNLTQAFTLESGKGGYIGTAALSDDLLPLEVLVSQTVNKSEVLNSIILRGVIEQAADATVPPEATGAADRKN